VGSRRAAQALVAEGAVTVNGEPAPAGTRVGPGDVVAVRGRVVVPPRGRRYLALHKPVGYVVSARDERGRATVLDLLPDAGDARRLFPVGRLDRDSSGLLLLTDDGELAYRLTHPRYKVEKEYVVEVEGRVRPAAVRRLESGVELDDGPTAPARVKVLAETPHLSTLSIVITEGRKRQVRRMMAAVGHPVRSLRRMAVGPIHLGRLRPGDHRRLRPPELARLRQTAGLAPDDGSADPGPEGRRGSGGGQDSARPSAARAGGRGPGGGSAPARRGSGRRGPRGGAGR
jgi:23S rRNA pseudouridine2605 synthase